MTTAITKSEVKNSKKGFTLVELVVVIAILAILAAIAIPVVNSIINTASRNGAISNAETIELAVKECQADIAARNTEVYDGTTAISNTDPAGNPLPTPLPNAATAHATIEIAHVAGAKSIPDAFATVTYNGNDYEPYWDTAADVCVWLSTTANNGVSIGDTIEGGAYSGALTVEQLANAGAILTGTAVAIDNL